MFMQSYCIQGKIRPRFIFAPFALFVMGKFKFKTGEIQISHIHVSLSTQAYTTMSCIQYICEIEI